MGKIRDFKTLPLSDQFMFAMVMRHKHISKMFLEELLQCKIARIEFIDAEADFSDAFGAHGIRLDVYLADKNNTHYDIEMQNRNDALERRSRYYQSAIDRRILEKNMSYRALPESYVIFICNFDYFKAGLAYYKRESFIKGTSAPYEDGSHVIFLNAKYHEKNGITPAIAEFPDYIRDANDDADFSTELAQEVRKRTEIVRNDKEKEAAYMTLAQYRNDAYDKGIAPGMTRGMTPG